MTASRRCLVVGGGLGGLATALRLRHEGWAVSVLEKNQQLGGRCNVFREDGFTFDTGPTLLLMRDVLDELFHSLGRRTEDYLDLVRLKPNYRVRFADGASVEFSSDFKVMEASLEELERGAGPKFRQYLEDAGYKYRVARERFVERNFLHWYNFATLANLYHLFTTNTLRMLDRHAGRYFNDPRLVAAFTFQTMYLGLPPHQAPAVYSLLPYTELEEGIWFPRGGMYSIVNALRTVAEEMGIEIHTETEVTRLQTDGRSVRGAWAGSRFMPADAVVCNADLPYAYESLVPADHVSRVQRARLDHISHGSSAFLMYLGLDREYPQLHHHDVFLSANIVGNFDAIFRDHILPSDPSFYTCVASRTDTSLAPPGQDGLYVLVPVPHQSPHIDWALERDSFRDLMYRKLEEVGLQDVQSHVVLERIVTPQDWAYDYNLQRGSAFGISHNFWQVGYWRPSNKAPGLDNLYFVGASTQPGGGIPMVFIGSRLVVERLAQDFRHAA